MSSDSAYRVSFTGPAADQYRAVLYQSANDGRDDEVRQAARQAVQLLSVVPLGMGDPMYRLRGMKLRVRHMVVPPLYIEYGVHDTEPIVFVRFVASIRGTADLL